jgi:uncharacterized protein (TIGR04141 family)
MGDAKTNKISVYLLKKEISPSDIFKKDHNHISKTLNSDNIFYYDESHTNPPSWIKGFFGDSLGDLKLFSGSSKGVYFVKVNIESEERFFAIPFGYGHSMIDKSYCEDDFGLKIVLNLVGKIRKIEKRTLSSEPKNTIEQLSKIGDISDFGIDIEQDLIEEITGKPTDPYFGDNLVTGKVAFTASVQVDVNNVEEFLKKSFEYYRKITYRTRFAFVDQVKEIINVDEWNAKLVDQLKNNNDDNVQVWMAIPEIIDWEDVAGFSYSSKKENLVSDILLDDFKKSLSDYQRKNLDIDLLKKQKVSCFRSSSDQEYVNWSSFNCLYCEITKDGGKFLLSNGKWYEIAKGFVEEIEKSYKDTMDSSSGVTYIDCNKEEHEDKYNERLAEKISGVLMDKKNITYGGGSSSIEFCDVYDETNKTFIHVKNYYGSSALSHLFAQGKVSGQMFLFDKKFRQEVKEKEKKLTFNPATDPAPNDYKIVFGIISESNNPLNIPFFSKVNFKGTKSLLNAFGCKNIFLTKIQRVK